MPGPGGDAGVKQEPFQIGHTQARQFIEKLGIEGTSPLCANMSETVTLWEFNVEGEQGSEADERDGDGPGGTGGGGGGEGEPTAIHDGVQAEDRPGGGRV